VVYFIVVSVSDYLALNGVVIGKDLDRTGRGLVDVLSRYLHEGTE
jgi:hypothetical protein